MRLLCAVTVALCVVCAGSSPVPHHGEPSGPTPSGETVSKGSPSEVKELVVKVSKFQNQTGFLLKQRLGIILSCGIS